MATKGSLGPLGQFFSRLFGELGGISEVGIVDICVLGDDRLDRTAHAVA
ncbi:hypothetical protein [Bradyrhizobium macuxiense]|nr:hypothetical protein [Bradyrhizobium macuxiense]